MIKKVFYFVLGVLFCVLGGSTLLPNIYHALAYAHVTGVVIDTNTSSTVSGHGFVFPVVKFVDRTGQTFTFISSEGIGIVSPANGSNVGDTVAVWYNARNPSEAVVYSFYRTWFMPSLFSLMGLGTLFIAFYQHPSSFPSQKIGASS